MLKYQPKEGSIVLCDFGGFISPEIIKTRRVVVMHVHPDNPGLVTVVPISLTPPLKVKDYHYLLEENFSQEHFSQKACWVKCDLVYVVSIERLKLQRNKKFGEYAPSLDEEILFLLKEKVKHGIGLNSQQQQNRPVTVG